MMMVMAMKKITMTIVITKNNLFQTSDSSAGFTTDFHLVIQIKNKI